ncbi:MAG: hypothetical protein JXQ73_24585 [Phycisphaerae bacterium]|nr:hypothetical protein [Phycisphaerae bacterium]
MSSPEDKAIRFPARRAASRDARRGTLWQRLVLALIGASGAIRGRRRFDDQEVRRHLWSDNTKRMGVRFSERIRDRFRGEWIRLHSRH